MICFKLLGSYWKPEGFSDNLCFSTCSPLCVDHFTLEGGWVILKTRHLAIMLIPIKINARDLLPKNDLRTFSELKKKEITQKNVIH